MPSDDVRERIDSFLHAWESGSRRSRVRLASGVPIAEMEWAALHHDDPWTRRRCIGFLDHYAADTSAEVFLAALEDPVAPVRDLALHGLACEQCRTEELDVTGVTSKVARVATEDPNPEVRYKSLPILLRLAGRDATAIEAIRRVADDDEDARVRAAAAALLAGERPLRWSRFRRSLAGRKAKASHTR